MSDRIAWAYYGENGFLSRATKLHRRGREGVRTECGVYIQTSCEVVHGTGSPAGRCKRCFPDAEDPRSREVAVSGEGSTD